jgi:MFS family permease
MTQVRDSDRQSAENAPTARRDFGLLWTGQSLSLFGDQFMILALPLFAVTVLKVSPAIAVLGNVALYLPFLVLGLPAGAIVEGMRYRSIMMAASALQMVTFGLIWLLAVAHVRSFALFIALILVGGCGVVFFQVSYTSYVPSLFRRSKDLHKANARLALSESASQSLGPMAAGPLIALLGTAGAIAGNALSFAVSLLTLALIRHREEPRPRETRERGWILRRVLEGLRFVQGHPMLQPILLCGTTYAMFLTMVETSLVLYCRNVLGLSPQWIGVVVGAAAAGYPIGNLLSARISDRIGAPRALAVSAAVSVAGIVSMPALGSIGGVAGAGGLIFGSIVHCAGEGSYSPTSLTLRQTLSPPELLSRVNAVQRFFMWGVVALGSGFASVSIALAGLSGALWIGAIGTVLCLPLLLRRGVRAAVFPTR